MQFSQMTYKFSKGKLLFNCCGDNVRFLFVFRVIDLLEDFQHFATLAADDRRRSSDKVRGWDARGNSCRGDYRRREIINCFYKWIVARPGCGRVIQQEARINLIVSWIAHETVHSPLSLLA